MAARIPFIKAAACGNDFLIIEAKFRPAEAGAFTRRICDRHEGIGADGVEWVSEGTDGAEVEASLINADGSPAEISGNGTRCVAANRMDQHPTSGAVVRVKTGAGVKDCRFISRAGLDFEFEMRVGVPEIQGERQLSLRDRSVTGLKLVMGNPQFVVFVDDFDFPWQALGAQIQGQAEFPEGTNVDFVRIAGPHQIESRFFERGAGETRSSGTGSSASAVAAIHAGRVKSPVTVKAVGGSQVVRWEESVFLQGPARLIGAGEFFI